VDNRVPSRRGGERKGTPTVRPWGGRPVPSAGKNIPIRRVLTPHGMPNLVVFELHHMGDRHEQTLAGIIFNIE
jgi:hypothetical protein